METIEGLNKYIVRDKLILKIFTIGYEPMGESIIILIIVDGVVKFSAVIDCFKTTQINKTLDILQEYNVEKVNFICITHPDVDHCKGFEKILEKANNKTVILYPVYMINDLNYDKDAKIVIDKLSEFVMKRKNDPDKPILKSCVGSCLAPINFIFENEKNGYKYPLIINTYSPVSEIIERPNAYNYLIEEFKRTNSHNNFSIMLSLTLGDFKSLFCGDIQNDSIDIVKRDLNMNDMDFFINTIDFFKIPHHCSWGSKNMLNLLSNCFIANSVTTIYNRGKSKLPNKEMLKKYIKKSEKTYCTSNIENEKENIYKYGIVELTANIFERTIRIEDKKYDEVEVM